MDERDGLPVRFVRRLPRARRICAHPREAGPGAPAGAAAEGIGQLFVHQAESLRLVAEGKNVVVVTPRPAGRRCATTSRSSITSSKTRHPGDVPVPDQALAEDQLHEFQEMVDAMGSDIRAFTYDGDTPQDARKAIRERASVVLTNPDMLHSGILPTTHAGPRCSRTCGMW